MSDSKVEEKHDDKRDRKLATEIDEEYKIWKKNTPFLYDIVMSHCLEWPSLTVQWLPEKIIPSGANYSIQRLVCGSHTNGEEPNYLHVLEVQLPLEDTDIDVRQYERLLDDGSNSSGYDSTYGKVSVVQSLPHQGEVHRARCCPQASQYIATKGPSEFVFVYDRTKHPAVYPLSKAPKPDFILKGHEKEGWGLAWSPLKQGQLLSGSDDALICLWDIGARMSLPVVYSSTPLSLPVYPPSHSVFVPPLRTFKGHTDVVEDVAFHYKNENMFGSVSDDRTFAIWDTRQSAATNKQEAHTQEVNALAFNPFNVNLFVTGSSDTTIGLWDLRNLSTKLHSFEAHYSEVTSVAWAPWSETILASASADRRVVYWDVTKIGVEQSPEDSEDGPPEVLFVHGGHTDKIVDFSFNFHEDWLIASVAEDNIMQIWQPAANIMEDEGADQPEAPKKPKKEVDPSDLE